MVDLLNNRAALETVTERQVSDEQLGRILTALRLRTGHDFSKYKRARVLRRIARRMQVTRSADLEAYYDVLRNDAEEAQALMGDLLISVTNFFRDREAFEALRTRVLPKLFRAKGRATKSASGSRLRNRRRGLFDRNAAVGGSWAA